MQKKTMFENFNMTETGDPNYPIMVGCRIRDEQQLGDWDEGWTVTTLSREEVSETYEFLKKFLGA